MVYTLNNGVLIPKLPLEVVNRALIKKQKKKIENT